MDGQKDGRMDRQACRPMDRQAGRQTDGTIDEGADTGPGVEGLIFTCTGKVLVIHNVCVHLASVSKSYPEWQGTIYLSGPGPWASMNSLVNIYCLPLPFTMYL
jgi:hypothetical protein